jgi:predicted membrane protein DUF2142
VRLAIVGGIVALLAGVAVAGAQSAHRQLSSNLVTAEAFMAVLEPGVRLCQDGESVPRGTGAIRLTLGSYGRPGPPLELTAGGTRTRLARGWREGTVLIRTPGIRAGATTVCLEHDGPGRVAVAGGPADVSVGLEVDGQPLGARARFEYTTAEARSWWSLLGEIGDRMAAIRVAFPAAATAWLWIALLAAVVGGVAALLLLPVSRAGLAVTLVALVNALAWGLVIPPFHVPDETAHFYYASYLARTGEVPAPSEYWYSHRMNGVLTEMEFPRVIGRPDNRQPWTDADRAAVQAQERSSIDDLGVGDAASASSNSPAYYGLQAAAYSLSPGADILDRLALMRVLSAVISALTVACVFGFLRELLPGSPAAATVGALVAALQPMFGFISSGVNNDGLLYLCSALLLFGIARAFRRGLTARRAVLIGGALGLGALVKTQLIAYAPAVVLALVLLSARARTVPWRALAAAAAATIAPLLVYYVLGQTVWERPVIDRVGAVTAVSEPTLNGMVSYVWQSYLPRLPFLQDWFGGLALKNLWVDGLIGRFGWLDYTFPRWVYWVG